MQFRTRHLVKTEDLNGNGTLFGGRALAWIDEEAYIFAACQMRLDSPRLVTKAMSAVDFKAPAKRGDIVELGCDVVRFGRTSVTIRCMLRNKTTRQNIVDIDEIVLVALDEQGRPYPHGVSEVVPYDQD